MKEKKTGGKIWEKAKIFQKPIKRAKNEIYKKISRYTIFPNDDFNFWRQISKTSTW